MSVMDMNSRMAMAEKLSIPQLQQAIQAGSLPAYIGIPLIEQKVKAQKQASAPQQQPQKPIAQEVMEQASGIDSVPSNLPISGYAGGGIASFAEGGEADDDFDYEEYLEQQDEAEYEDAMKRYMAEAEAAGIEGIPIHRTKKVEHKFANGGIAAFANGNIVEEANAALGMGDLEQINPMLERTNVPQPTRFLADADILREDPAYRSFVEGGGYNGDTSIQRYMELGNPTPNSIVAENRRIGLEETADAKAQRDLDAQAIADRNLIQAAEGANLAADKDIRANVTRAGGTALDYAARGINALGGNVPRVPPEYTFNRSDINPSENLDKFNRSQIPESGDPGGSVVDLNAPVRRAPQNIDSQYIAQDKQEGRPQAATGARAQPTAGQPSAGGATGAGTTGTGGVASLRGAGGAGGAGRAEATNKERPKSAFDAFIEDIKASREDLKKQQAQDKYMALLSAGLGMMSGTSPNAFANIGQGAQAGVASYAASQKQRAAERAALNKNLLMGQRYQSMEDIAARTADINEARYREAAAARAAGSGDAASLKQDRILDQREAALARAIQQGQATVANALKTQFGDTGMYTNKAAFEKAYKDLTDRYVTPYVLKRNQLDQQRFPDIFGTNAQQPAGGSSSTVIKYDNKGNPIQ